MSILAIRGLQCQGLGRSWKPKVIWILHRVLYNTSDRTNGSARECRLDSAVRHTSARWKAGTEAHVEFANDTDFLFSIRSLHLIRLIFGAVAGLRSGMWGCYPAKLLFGLLQLRSEALDEKIMFCSHIGFRAHNPFDVLE